MRATHDAFAPPFWLGVTLVVNLVAPGSPVGPVAVVAGAVASIPLAGGRNSSPDLDLRIWNARPQPGYPLWGHRGITHRWWLALILVAVFGLLPFLGLLALGVPVQYASLAFGPISGWCSHLAGDQWFGRLRVLGKSRGLGWVTGGGAEPQVRRQLAAAVPLLGAAHLLLYLGMVPSYLIVLGVAMGWVAIWVVLWVPRSVRRARPQGGSGIQGGSQGGVSRVGRAGGPRVGLARRRKR